MKRNEDEMKRNEDEDKEDMSIEKMKRKKRWTWKGDEEEEDEDKEDMSIEEMKRKKGTIDEEDGMKMSSRWRGGEENTRKSGKLMRKRPKSGRISLHLNRVEVGIVEVPQEPEDARPQNLAQQKDEWGEVKDVHLQGG